MIREYFRPSTMTQALELVQSHRATAKVLAGGTDLLLHLATEQHVETSLVSLRDVEEFRNVSETLEGDVFIGAMVRHGDIARSPLVNRHFSALARASGWVGSPSIRNTATIGGNICNASPSADTAPPLLAYDAKAVIVNSKGQRIIDIQDFFKGPSINVLLPGEILKGLLLTPKPGWRVAYEKLGVRKAMEIAIVNGCVAISMDENRRCRDIRIALGAVAPTPIRARIAEAIVKGQKVTAELIQKSAVEVVAETRPISDIRATAEYRKEMVHVMVCKVLFDLVG